MKDHPEASRLSLGTAQWGQRYGIANTSGRPSSAELSAIVSVATEAGVLTMDTARDYGDSEERIGSVIQDASWRVVTKVTSVLPAGSAEAAVLVARTSVSASLRALRQDTLDTLLVHRLEHVTNWDGAVWRMLIEHRDTGLVRKLGASTLGPAQAWAALDNPEIQVVQVASNLFDQRLLRSGFFEAAQQAGKEVFVRSVFLQGVGHLRPEQLPTSLAELREPLRRIQTVAATQEWQAFAPFLYFAYGIPGARVLIGAETAPQLRECLAEWALAPSRFADVSELAVTIPVLEDRVLNPWQW